MGPGCGMSWGVALLMVLSPILATPVRYDQRQSGNVNVQVDLRDVEIYAILDDSLLSGLGDYDYDYSQLTEKPPKPANSTISTSSTTSSPNKTTKKPSTSPTQTSVVIGRTNALASSGVFAEEPLGQRSSSALLGALSAASAVSARVDAEGTPTTTAASAPTSVKPRVPTVRPSSAKPSAALAGRRCGAGFHRDASGRCRRDKRPFRKHGKPGRRAPQTPAKEGKRQDEPTESKRQKHTMTQTDARNSTADAGYRTSS